MPFTCPLNKNPCHLNNPSCNITPGLYFVKNCEEKTVRMCGDCQKETKSEIVAQARNTWANKK